MFWSRVKVVLTAAVTYITIIQAALVIFADEIAQLFADGTAAGVINVIVRAGAVLTAVVSIIRRVTPVLPSDRGILPGG
jgi:VanZ family protein